MSEQFSLILFSDSEQDWAILFTVNEQVLIQDSNYYLIFLLDFVYFNSHGKWEKWKFPTPPTIVFIELIENSNLIIH